MLIWERDAQNEKHFTPIYVIESGRVIWERDEQPIKHLSPRVRIELGK
jgi:hypothetical protein